MLALTAVAPGPALATVPATGSTRTAILRVAVIATNRTARCFQVNLASRGSAWAIVQTPGSDENNSSCDNVQVGGYAIVHYEHGRWTLVSSSDPLVCPIASRPGEPVISSTVVRELTGLHCDQPTTAGRHRPRLPTERSGKAGLAVEPREIGFTGDGTGYLGGYTNHRSVRLWKSSEELPFGSLVWERWTDRVAMGYGAEWLNDGIPDDASGTFHPFQATVWASRPRNGVFTRMRVQSFSNDGNPHTTLYSAQYFPPTSHSPGYWEWF